MAENKTKPTGAAVESFLDKTDDAVRKDCYTLIGLMEKATNCKAKMWGTAIIGFDEYHYKYESGREGDICLIGFSPRKGNLSLYVHTGSGEQQELLSKLGKHKTGKGCLYINKLDDVKLDVLGDLIAHAVAYMRKKHNG